LWGWNRFCKRIMSTAGVDPTRRSDWRLPRKAAYRVMVVGAGAVGEEMVRVLRQRAFPVHSIDVRARSERTATIDGEEYHIGVLGEDVPEGTDLVLMAGAEDAIPDFAWQAAQAGAIAIDNSSAWRLDDRVPLVVPEVNPEDVEWHQGLIANPNCSTIQMVVALMPLHRVSRIKRIIVSTYQSVSGTGRGAVEELRAQNRARDLHPPDRPELYTPDRIVPAERVLHRGVEDGVRDAEDPAPAGSCRHRDHGARAQHDRAWGVGVR
jgi:aspartate-semialdehyde dehydrogenase